MSAEREPRGRRAPFPLARALAALAVASGMALTALTAPPLTVAAHSATTAADDEIAITLIAAPAASGIVRPGEPISVRVTVTNSGDVRTGGITLRLAIDGARDADTAALSSWFGNEVVETEGNAITVAAATLSSLEPGASAVLDLIVPAAESAVSGDFGARLAAVYAEIAPDDSGAELGSGELGVDHTALVWVPDDTTAPVASTTFVAAITTPGEPAAFLSADDLERYTGVAGGLTRTLDAVAGRSVLLAIDPRILASIRLLGAQAPASATAFLARLQAVPNESFLLPWADADPLATIAANSMSLPLPEGAGIVTTVEGDGTTTPSPSPSLTPEQSITIAELTAWPVSLDKVAWAETGNLTTIAVSVLEAQGTRVLLAPGSELDQPAAVQTLDAVRVLRLDDALSTAARAASVAVSQQRFDHAMARMSALLASNATEQPGVPTLIALSRDRFAGTDRLIDTIAQTVSLPWSTGAAASAALSRDAVSGAVLDPALDESYLDAVRSALAAEADDRVFATIAVAPTAITDVRRLELLGALSLGWGARSPDALRAFVVDSIALRSAVQVVESSDITLLADRASLPVTVQNSLDVAVRVFVRVEPDTAQLRVVDSRVETLVEPNSQTRALVPVESLTNGQVDITVTVRDDESRVVGSPTRVALNLQAGWETAGTIAIAIALVLLLVFGIARDIRKRRRHRAEQA